MRNDILPYDSMLKIKSTHKVGDPSSRAVLRLKRWKARRWMRENGVRDLGYTIPTPKINQ